MTWKGTLYGHRARENASAEILSHADLCDQKGQDAKTNDREARIDMSNVLVREKLCLKNIYELLGERFYIPAYQRGYRWSEIQVKELLDDIWEFSQQASSEKSAFYCLQPIVVVKRDDHWEVVDGQQRLTTLYIILHYLEKEHLRRELQEAYKKPLYALEYETRSESESFLENIRSPEETNNIDFFHIASAYKAIAEWFDNRDFNENK